MPWGLSSPVVGLCVALAWPHLPLLDVDNLVERGAERGAEGPPPWFGRTKGSTNPYMASLGTSFGPSAGMIAKGIMAMCSASSSMPMVAKAWFAGDASPSRAKVETEPMKGTRALLAMVIAKVFEETRR
jgi:hypothetical protein